MMYKSDFSPCTMILASTLICMMTKHWAMVWVVLELSTLGFLMMLSLEGKKQKMLVFFLFQSFASMMMVIFLFSNSEMMEQNSLKMMAYLILLMVMMKTGLFPFHTWLMEMAMNMGWNNITLMLTWQKLIPMMMVMMMASKANLPENMILMMMMTILIMTSMSMMKKILISSSLIHSGWMIISMKIIKTAFMAYLVVYSVILILINSMMMKNNMKSIISQMSGKSMEMSKTILMFTMASIPPSMGFTLKLMVLFLLIKTQTQINTIIVLMVVSSLSFLVYFKLFYKTMVNMKNNEKKMNFKKLKKTKMIWMNLLLPIVVLG